MTVIPAEKDPEKPTDEAQLFREAVRGVKPLGASVPAAVAPKVRARARFTRADRAAVLRESLERRERGPGQSPPAMSWCFISRTSRRASLRRLRRGEYRVQREIDLHGLSVAQAKQALRQFLIEALEEHVRCVRIIHGKGLRSGHRGPVLKGVVSAVLRHTRRGTGVRLGAAGRRGHRCALRAARGSLGTPSRLRKLRGGGDQLAQHGRREAAARQAKLQQQCLRLRLDAQLAHREPQAAALLAACPPRCRRGTRPGSAAAMRASSSPTSPCACEAPAPHSGAGRVDLQFAAAALEGRIRLLHGEDAAAAVEVGEIPGEQAVASWRRSRARRARR